MSVHQVSFNFNLYKMHGEYNIKYIDAQQASQIYKHRNIKVKLYALFYRVFLVTK